MKSFLKWKSTLLLIITAALSYLFLFPINHIVVGICIVYFAFFAFAFFSFYIFVTVFSIIGKIKYKIKFNFIPSIIAVIYIVTLFMEFYHDKSLLILSADRKTVGVERNEMIAAAFLSLNDNNTYGVELLRVESSECYNGEYNIVNDTLFLGDNIADETRNIISDKYLINSTLNMLIPIENCNLKLDTNKWLKIDSITSVLRKKISNQ